MANHLLQSCLYCDDWWAWYSEALLTDTGAGEAPGTPCGRVKGASARDYLDLITAAHARLDQLLAAPESEWPQRQDGKLIWLKAKIDQAQVEADNANSAEARKALEEATADLKNYVKLVPMGGY